MPAAEQSQPFVASRLHLVLLLLLLFGMAAAGFLTQHHAASVPNKSGVSGPSLADHSKIIHIYLVGLMMIGDFSITATWVFIAGAEQLRRFQEAAGTP